MKKVFWRTLLALLLCATISVGAQAKTLAGYGDFSGYAALGYTPEQIAAMQAA